MVSFSAITALRLQHGTEIGWQSHIGLLTRIKRPRGGPAPRGHEPLSRSSTWRVGSRPRPCARVDVTHPRRCPPQVCPRTCPRRPESASKYPTLTYAAKQNPAEPFYTAAPPLSEMAVAFGQTRIKFLHKRTPRTWTSKGQSTSTPLRVRMVDGTFEFAAESLLRTSALPGCGRFRRVIRRLLRRERSRLLLFPLHD
jgi:hypothetical protein